MIYTAWGKDGRANTLIEGDGPPQIQDECNSELIWSIEASSWEEAMQEYHKLQGWEPYRRMGSPMSGVLLNVQRPGTEKIPLHVKLIELATGNYRLSVAWPDASEERHFDDVDVYECLRAFRRVIEPDGFRVLCWGARPNVCPSGMARAAGAWECYAHRLGQPASINDLAGTFDDVGDIEYVGTVEEQDEFMRRHWEELKKQ
jgi:hypothetical protein